LECPEDFCKAIKGNFSNIDLKETYLRFFFFIFVEVDSENDLDIVNPLEGVLST